MKRKAIIFGIAIAAGLPLMADNLKIEVPVEHDWWWNAPEVPELTVNITDTVGNSAPSTIKLEVAPDLDKKNPVIVMTQEVMPAKGTPQQMKFAFPKLSPGFYKVTLSDGDKAGKEFWIGYEPQNVVSLPDNQADIDAFWQRANEELAQVPVDYTLKELPEKSGKKRKTYQVEILSLGGDTIKGYVTIPVKKGKYPVHIYYNGYGAEPWTPGADDRPEWIELNIFARGQGLDKPTNKYGDWIQYGLDNPENYYYRGAFMDCVRALDFAGQLPQADGVNFFAEGGSQGGAFTLAAAALDPKKRLRAIAPYIPFLSDYPHYFEIVDWPAYPVKTKAAQLGMTPEQMYRNLSYFDLKNLARRIDTPLLMGVGLQDPVCPPHTNFSSFNLINSEKDFIIYPECGHTVVYEDWNPQREAFFNTHLAK